MNNEKKAINAYVKSIKKIPLLTKEEETRLVKQYQSGSQKACDKLITSNLRLVIHQARKYKAYMNTKVTFLDLVQSGNLGLIEAIKKFQLGRAALSSYAIWWIRAYMLNFIEYNHFSIRLRPGKERKNTRMFYKKHLVERILLTQDPEKKEKLREEAASNLLVTVDEIKSMEQYLSLRYSNEFDENWQPLFHKESDAEKNIHINQLMKTVYATMKEFSPRYQSVIINRWLESEGTLQEAGEKIGVSSTRARQIQAKIFKKIKSNMLEVGIDSFNF